ncbi:MAG: hypothetical protein LAT55_06835 [Opitutales bacterium]|nr:hypothetical protein [Opitutales bacterium]
MKWQLFYTSSRRGLESGSYGFTVVAREREFPGRLQRHLVRLSHFDQRLRNPEGLASFRIFETNGETYYILSRIRKAGSDYSGRGNFLAQHLILDKAETFGLPGPAILLRDWAGWRENWNDPARYLEESDYPDWPETKPDRKAWTSIAGDADYAAHWALISERETPVAMKLPMADSLTKGLALFADSGALLKDDAWKKPFTTCLQIKDKPEDFEWLCLVPKVSPEKTISFPETHFFDFTQDPPKLPESQGKKLRMEKQHDGARQLRGDYFRRAPKPGEVRVKQIKKKGPQRSAASSSGTKTKNLRLYAAGGAAALVVLGALGFILIHFLSSPPPPPPPGTQNGDRLFPPSAVEEASPREDDTIPSLTAEREEDQATDLLEEIEEDAPPLWEIHLSDLIEALEREKSSRAPFVLSSAEALISYQGFLSAEPPSEKIREIQDRLPWTHQNYFLFIERAEQLQSNEGVASFSDWSNELYELVQQSTQWMVPQLADSGNWAIQEASEGSSRRIYTFEESEGSQTPPQDDLIIFTSEEAEERELFLPQDLGQILRDQRKLYLELHFSGENHPPVGLYILVPEEQAPLQAPREHLQIEPEEPPLLSLIHWPEDLLRPALGNNRPSQNFRLTGTSPSHFPDDQISAWIEMILTHEILLETANTDAQAPAFHLLPSKSEEFPIDWPEHATLSTDTSLEELENELAGILSSKAEIESLLAFSRTEFTLDGLQDRWSRYTRGEGWHGERTEKQLLLVAQNHEEIHSLIIENRHLWENDPPNLQELESALPPRPNHEGLTQSDWLQEIFAHFILLSAWQLEDDQLLVFHDEPKSTENTPEDFEENGESEERTEGNGNGNGTDSENEETEPTAEGDPVTSDPETNEEEDDAVDTQDPEEEEESPLRKRLNQTSGTYRTVWEQSRGAWQDELQNRLDQLNDTLQEARITYLAAFLEEQFSEEHPFFPWSLTHQERPLIRFE